MRLAIDMAKEAYCIGEVPVGCVIADAEGNVINNAGAKPHGFNREDDSDFLSFL